MNIRVLYSSVSFRLIFWVGMILLAAMCTWAYVSVECYRAAVAIQMPDSAVAGYVKRIIGFSCIVFIGTATALGWFLVRSINLPIKRLIDGTKHIGQGDYHYQVTADRDDEIGQLAKAINHMGKNIAEKQTELNKQRDEYQTLFDETPCYITLHDRDLKLIHYNRQFAEKFSPKLGDYCYQAYKGRDARCEICPVLHTFEDGSSHSSEETGMGKDGHTIHWLVRATPIKDATGAVVAAMEMCIDVTDKKLLEQAVAKTEEKYQVIFNTIPNPVFVLDRDTLSIMDCNDRTKSVYGFSKHELVHTPFLNLFEKDDQHLYEERIKNNVNLEQARQIRRDGSSIYVSIRTSSSEYSGREALLVTTSDITKKLMAEQQLIQASKMSTLGEMATGVAHELNQPLTVMKAASSYIMKKIKNQEQIDEQILHSIAEEVDSQVDRASKIIRHMREFGRTSDVTKERVNVNEVLQKALEIFSQQLTLRQIAVVMDMTDNIPMIMAEPNRLEQVFINLLINARDAIEEKREQNTGISSEDTITLKTYAQNGTVVIEFKDSGVGVPHNLVDKIFEPFFTTKKVGKGTGLGLSISYGIIQDYGGHIRVESTEGVESDFIITFPYEDVIT